MAYDSRCYDLAEIFLLDEPALEGQAPELAQVIQTEIENWIQYERDIAPKKAAS